MLQVKALLIIGYLFPWPYWREEDRHIHIGFTFPLRDWVKKEIKNEKD